MPPIPNIRVPAGTRVGGSTASGDQLVFETERAIGLTGARLAQVATLWPGRDSYADHTDALAASTPVELFSSTKSTPHILYLAHDRLFALSGESIIEVEFDLTTPSSQDSQPAMGVLGWPGLARFW